MIIGNFPVTAFFEKNDHESIIVQLGTSVLPTNEDLCGN
jgi:hypothetical protein